MKIATTSLACLLALGFTACLQESEASESSKTTPEVLGEEVSTPPVVEMTTTQLEMGRVP